MEIEGEYWEVRVIKDGINIVVNREKRGLYENLSKHNKFYITNSPMSKLIFYSIILQFHLIIVSTKQLLSYFS